MNKRFNVILILFPAKNGTGVSEGIESLEKMGENSLLAGVFCVLG